MRCTMVRFVALGLAVASFAGCGTDDSAGLASEYAIPGSDSAVVSHTIPAAMFPGERRVVEVTMRNTGAAPGTNDWGSSAYRLNYLGTFFGWANTPVVPTVAVGSTFTFRFVIQAPTTEGAHTFSARMFESGYFGATLSAPVTVSSAVVPHWQCQFEPSLSTIPSSLAPGANATVTVAVRNTGSQSWPSSGLSLSSIDSPVNLWANISSSMSAPTAPGDVFSFSFGIRAPSTPGTYSLRRQMRDTRGVAAGAVGLFRADACLDAAITVGGAAARDAAVASHTIPSTMAPNEVRAISVTMQNSGTETWLSGGNYVLYSTSSPTNLFGATIAYVTTETTPSSAHSFTISTRAPSAPGTYQQRWRMRKLSGDGAGFFGDELSVTVTVDASATPSLDAVVVSQTIPATITAGATASFSISVQNTGTETWGTGFSLFSTNSPSTLWNFTNAPLASGEMVAPGATRAFTFTVTAPAAAGSYDSRWRMRSSTVGVFGEEAVTLGIVVTACGNGAIDPGETCDDGNTMAGDGCSSTCAVEGATVDLAIASADRTVIGGGDLAGLAATAIGDVTGDGVPDVIVGEGNSVPGIVRSAAGVVYGFSGGVGFFTGTSTALPADSNFQIVGADANDYLGTASQSGGIVVGNLVGDASPDLIVSAPLADGPSNARSAAGEVYILTGGTALLTAGTIDLATGPTIVAATIVGPVAEDRIRPIAVADATGDGIDDLILGAPRNDAGGTDAGAIYIVSGAVGFAGTIDLAAPGAVPVYTIVGPQAAAGIGDAVAVGDFGGTTAADIVTGSTNYDPAGLTNAGGAWGVLGPVTSDRNLASDADVVWLGPSDFVRVGSAAAIGNVTGTAAGDVVLGSLQWMRGGAQVGAVLVYPGPLTSGTVFDMSATAPPTVLLGREAGDTFGGVVGVGDANGDGYLDIGITAPYADGPDGSRTSAGEFEIVLGSATMPALRDMATSPGAFLVYGSAGVDIMGALEPALAFGDVDGDGLSDMCIGSHLGGSSASVSEGRVDCFMGF